ncbi:GtrA family protein [Tropicibacter naphthalenivorans]|nr:GtrA family protein [Tropicibacter naphthalenivorans]
MTDFSTSRFGRVLGRFTGFTLVSGMGWVLDFCVMGTLVQLGSPVFYANLVGAFCGVTLVYFIAGFKIFEKSRPQSHATLLSFYWLWHACAIAGSSALIAYGSTWLIHIVPDTALRPQTFAGLGAKILLTPISMVGNFLFMRFLLESRKRD